MYKVESKTEQPILSKELKTKEKLKEFRQYLVQKDIILLIVKFLLSIKNAKEQPGDLTQAFKDYIGAVAPDTSAYDQLTEQVEQEKTTTKSLQSQIEQVKAQIKQAKEDKIKREEQERIRLEQEAQKKDSKKPGKK